MVTFGADQLALSSRLHLVSASRKHSRIEHVGRYESPNKAGIVGKLSIASTSSFQFGRSISHYPMSLPCFPMSLDIVQEWEPAELATVAVARRLIFPMLQCTYICPRFFVVGMLKNNLALNGIRKLLWKTLHDLKGPKSHKVSSRVTSYEVSLSTISDIFKWPRFGGMWTWRA